VVRHGEDAELVHRSEAVLGGAQQAIVEGGLALEVEHGVHDVLERLGPAMPPPLVTWPTTTTAVPLSLAKRISWPEHSRTCPTLPGALSSRSV
jgi:hypothetical protein